MGAVVKGGRGRMGAVVKGEGQSSVEERPGNSPSLVTHTSGT
jgi:hypothetical protein